MLNRWKRLSKNIVLLLSDDNDDKNMIGVIQGEEIWARSKISLLIQLFELKRIAFHDCNAKSIMLQWWTTSSSGDNYNCYESDFVIN